MRLELLVSGVLAMSSAGDPLEAQRDHDWDAVFTRESGWNAGDIGHAIDLEDGRTLWLFGDSILGPVRGGERVGDESKFVRGAIGWHETPDRGAIPPEVRFGAPEAFAGVPEASWISPDEALWDGEVWYWLMGDGRMVVDDAGERRFVFFAMAIGPSGNPDGVWNFRRVGGAIITVHNPAAEPQDWQATQVRHPLVDADSMHGDPPRAGVNWGLAVVEDPDGGWFVFGVREGAGASDLLVARCAAEDLDDPGDWSFFDGERWSTDPADAASVARGLVSEFTVQWLRRGGEPELVLIQSEPMLGRWILARTARAPEGPWSEPARLFEAPEPAADERLMVYAAKGHAHLSRPGEMLLSYAVNSRDFWQIWRDASLYRPRFVRVPMARLPAAPE